MDLKKPERNLASTLPVGSCKYEDLIDFENELHEPQCVKLPSACHCQNVSWIWASLPVRVEPVHSGKWMIFPGKQSVDQTWEKVKILLAANQLASGAKIAPNGSTVICVYTNNYEDVPDVFRVLVALRQNRIQIGAIHYKTDDATFSGAYATGEAAHRAGFDCNKRKRNPRQKVSMYTSPPYEETGATEKIQMLLNNIGPEYKSGLVAELVKNADDTEPKITFYNPPKIIDSSSKPRNSKPYSAKKK